VRAAVSGKIDEMNRLVQGGADPNYLEEGAVPMLIWTMCAQNKKGYEALLKAGADPNLGGTGHGFTSPGVVGHPFTRGDSSIVSRGWSATVMAATIEDPYYLRLALQYGGDPDAKKGEVRDRPLLLASYEGFIENVRILLDAGADVNIHDERYPNYNAAVMAIRGYNRYDIIMLLLERGFDFDLPLLLRYLDNPVNDEMRPNRDKVIQLVKERMEK
jgi:ankyrin repeat protein